MKRAPALFPQYKKLFDEIKRTDQAGTESWSARELMSRLGYNRWENFKNSILKAITACKNSGINPIGQFRETTKQIKIHQEVYRSVGDYRLTRYACYLLAQNGKITKKLLLQ